MLQIHSKSPSQSTDNSWFRFVQITHVKNIRYYSTIVKQSGENEEKLTFFYFSVDYLNYLNPTVYSNKPSL